VPKAKLNIRPGNRGVPYQAPRETAHVTATQRRERVGAPEQRSRVVQRPERETQMRNYSEHNATTAVCRDSRNARTGEGKE